MVSMLNLCLPAVFDKGVVVSGVCLTAVYHHSDKFIILRNGDFLAWGSSRPSLSTPAVLTMI